MRTLTLLVALMVLTGAARSCPSDWTRINGRCFLYVASKHTWPAAEKACENLGGNLASVHSSEEYFEIQKMIVKTTQAFDRTWLGGTDCQNEGTWLWSDGTPFKYRHCGKFDNRWGNQHCLQMNYGSNKCWDDERCSRRLPFVCAKRIQRRFG